MKDNSYSIRAIFRKFDKDGDNFISFAEFSKGLRDVLIIKISEKEADEIFEVFD